MLPVLNFDKISFSEASRLAACEKQWDFQYNREGFEFEATQPMSLGTVVHHLIRTWWQDGPITARAELEHLEHGYTDLTDTRTQEAWNGLDEEKQITAGWLLDRYDSYYGPWDSGLAERSASEVHLAARYNDLILHAYFDHIVKDKDGGLWLVERKTMSQWNRLDILHVDPQITLYVALAQLAGLEVEGVLFDAIRTYRWKRDDREPAESFERVYLDRTDTQIAEALADLDEVIERRAELREGRRPVRNLSAMSCRGCSFKETCFEELAFGQQIEIV